MDLHPGMKGEKLQPDWDVKSHNYLKGCDAHLSGTHTNISTRLPSIYRVWQVLRHWLMMLLLWGLSRWQSTTPNQFLIVSSYLHTNTCALELFVFLIIWSAPHFPTQCYALLSVFSLSFQTHVGCHAVPRFGSWCYFMMHKSEGVLKLSLYILFICICNFPSEWFVIQLRIETCTLKFSIQAALTFFTLGERHFNTYIWVNLKTFLS